MSWWIYLLGGVLIYLFFKKNVLKKIEEIAKWYKLNKDKLNEWEKNQQIMNAYKSLEAAIKNAQLDKKWTTGEILSVLSLAYNLFRLIKEYEEKKK